MDGDFRGNAFTLEAMSEDERVDNLLSAEAEKSVMPSIEPKTDFTYQDRLAISIQMQIYVQDRVRIHKVGVTISYHPIGSFLKNLVTTLNENSNLDELAKSKPVLESLYIILSLLLDNKGDPLLKAKLESGALVGTLIYTMYMIGLMTQESYKAYRRSKESSDNAKSMNFETRVQLLQEFRRFIRTHIDRTYGVEAVPTLSNASWDLFRIALTGRKSTLRKQALNTLFQDYTHTTLSFVHNLEDYLTKPRAAVKGKQTNLSLARFFKDILVLSERNKNNEPELLALYALAEHYVSGADNAKLESSIFLPVLIRGFALRLCPNDTEFLATLEGIKKLSVQGRALVLAHLQDAIKPTIDEKIPGQLLVQLNALFSKILTRDNEVFRSPLLDALYAYFRLSLQKFGADPDIKVFAQKIAFCPTEFHALFIQLYPSVQAELSEILHKEVSDVASSSQRLDKFTEYMEASDHPVAQSLVSLANEPRALGGMIPNLRAWALVIDYFLDPDHAKHLAKEKDKFVRAFINAVGMTLYSAEKTLTDQLGKPLSLENTTAYLEKFKARLVFLLSQYGISDEHQNAFKLLCTAVFTTKKKQQQLLLNLWNITLLALTTKSNTKLRQVVAQTIEACGEEFIASLGLRAISRELSDIGNLFPDPKMVALIERQGETAPPLAASSPFMNRDSSDEEKSPAKSGRGSSSFFGALKRSSKAHTPESTLAASPAVTKKEAIATAERQRFFAVGFLGKKNNTGLSESDDEDMKNAASSLSFSLSSSEE